MHPCELSLYDPRPRKSVFLYPPSPPLRAAYVDTVREVFTPA